MSQSLAIDMRKVNPTGLTQLDKDAHNGSVASRKRLIVPPQVEYVALIGDIVNSRGIRDRAKSQKDLIHLLSGLNKLHKDQLTSLFTITSGDEFQALFEDPSVIPELLVKLERGFVHSRIRFGIGKGVLSTKLEHSSIGMDGPAWHLAREAIQAAKAQGQLGGVYLGFGDPDDQVLNAISSQAEWYRGRYYERYSDIFLLLEEGLAQIDISARLKKKKQQVSEQIARSGWRHYWKGQMALKAVLSRHQTQGPSA